MTKACNHVWGVVLVRVDAIEPGRGKRHCMATAERICSMCHVRRSVRLSERILASDTPSSVAARVAGRAIGKLMELAPLGGGWRRR
jgi:hypothetical protein